MITKAKEILAGAKDKMAHAVTHLDEELKTYRAGKANIFCRSPLSLSSIVSQKYSPLTYSFPMVYVSLRAIRFNVSSMSIRFI